MACLLRQKPWRRTPAASFPRTGRLKTLRPPEREMSGKRNIGRDDSDPTYRYKMPKLETKKEGAGNGTKTRIVNLSQVARALRVDPACLSKCFGLHFGAQSKLDSSGGCIVNGWHEIKELNQALDEFVEKFVLCPRCRLPEIDLEAERPGKKGGLQVNCRACGLNQPFLYSEHKLSSFFPFSPKKKGGKKLPPVEGRFRASPSAELEKKSGFLPDEKDQLSLLEEMLDSGNDEMFSTLSWARSEDSDFVDGEE